MLLSTYDNVRSKCMAENKRGNARETSASELLGGLFWNKDKRTNTDKRMT